MPLVFQSLRLHFKSGDLVYTVITKITLQAIKLMYIILFRYKCSAIWHILKEALYDHYLVELGF